LCMYTCRLNAVRQQVACARFNGNTDAIIVLDNAHQIRGRRTARTRSLAHPPHARLFSSPGSRKARRPRANSQQTRKSRIVSPPPRSRTASRGVIKYFETELCKCRESAELLMTFAARFCRVCSSQADAACGDN
jgi:hypothetical protein